MMDKSEPIGEWIKRQGRIHIRYGEAVELIQDIQKRKDNLELELLDWIAWGDDVVGMLCDLFDIEKPEASEKMSEEAKTEVEKTIITVPREGEKKITIIVGDKMKTHESIKEVKTVIVVTCEGEYATREVHDKWWKRTSITEIADTTKEAVERIT